MQLTSLIALGIAVFASFSGGAQTVVWSQGSDCQRLSVPPIHLSQQRVLFGQRDASVTTEQHYRHLKLALLKDIAASGEGQQYLVSRVNVYRNALPVEGFGEDAYRLVVKASFTPVSGCTDGQLIDLATAENFNSLFSANAANRIELKAEFVFSVDTPRPQRLRKVASRDLVLTDSGVMGLALGSTMTDFYERFGRPSMHWQVSASRAVMMIGKRLALFYRNNELVGYQYADHLLPMVLHNDLEFFEQFNDLNLQLSPDTKVKLGSVMTNNEALLLQDREISVEFVDYQLSEQQTQRKLVAIAAGDVFADVTSEPLQCVDLDNFAGDGKYNVIRYYDQNQKLKWLTGCQQILSFKRERQLRQLELIQPLSTRSIALAPIASALAQQSPWRFADLNYLTKVSRAFQADVRDDVLHFENQHWFGEFYLEHSKLVEAKLTYLE